MFDLNHSPNDKHVLPDLNQYFIQYPLYHINIQKSHKMCSKGEQLLWKNFKMQYINGSLK